jgi:integrase
LVAHVETRYDHYQALLEEIIALLVIAPSKNDRERIIPMSAEVFHVLAQVIRRHTRTSPTVPLITRYDTHERIWSAPLPFLFQRNSGTTRAVMNRGTVLAMLHNTCAEIGETDPRFAGVAFTPYDFRRLFATEIVNGGLPIHIGAVLLGHVNVQTTHGYVAESSGIASGGRELAGCLVKLPARATIADSRKMLLTC